MVKESILVWGSKTVSLGGRSFSRRDFRASTGYGETSSQQQVPTPAHRTLEGEDTWESVRMEARSLDLSLVPIPLSSKARSSSQLVPSPP